MEAFSVPVIREAAGRADHAFNVRGSNARAQRIVSTVKMLGESGVIAGNGFIADSDRRYDDARAIMTAL